MRVIVCENYEELSAQAAKIMASQVILKPDSVLGLATGSTPVGMYRRLAEMCRCGELDFSRVVTFNLDEYYPIEKANSQSYHYFMDENFFLKINIAPGNIHIPNGEAADPEAECRRYDQAIADCGGIDLQLLGIGRNGHIGFNEPGDALHVSTHVTRLTEDTIRANSRFFEKIEEMPTRALTMGIGAILRARRILLLVSGANKHDALMELFTPEIKTTNPATLLKVHPDVILICDRDAYGDGPAR